MSETLTIDHAAATLHAQLCEAREAEKDAEKALGEAALVAARGGAAAPGRLAADLEAARSKRVEIEAALAAADRALDVQAQTDQEQRRAARVAEINRAADELVSAAKEITAALKKFAVSEAGLRMTDAVGVLLRACGGMEDRVLTAEGWVLAEGLSNLRDKRERAFARFSGLAMQQAMEGEAPEALLQHAEQTRKLLQRAALIQRAEWPSA